MIIDVTCCLKFQQCANLTNKLYSSAKKAILFFNIYTHHVPIIIVQHLTLCTNCIFFNKKILTYDNSRILVELNLNSQRKLSFTHFVTLKIKMDIRNKI